MTAAKVLNEQLHLHDVPRGLYSDQGKNLESSFRPQSSGMIECFNAMLK